MLCRHTSDLALAAVKLRTVLPARATVLTSPSDLLRNRLSPMVLWNSFRSGLESVARPSNFRWRISFCLLLLLPLEDLASEFLGDVVVNVIVGVVLLAFLKSVVFELLDPWFNWVSRFLSARSDIALFNRISLASYCYMTVYCSARIVYI